MSSTSIHMFYYAKGVDDTNKQKVKRNRIRGKTLREIKIELKLKMNGK